MSLPTNKFLTSLEAAYGENWREACPEDTGYTYGHLWRMTTGKSKIPLILQKYIDVKLSRKRPKPKGKANEKTKAQVQKIHGRRAESIGSR